MQQLNLEEEQKNEMICKDKAINAMLEGKSINESQIFLRQNVGIHEEKLMGLEDEINVMNDMDSGDEELEKRWNETNELYDETQTQLHKFTSALQDVDFKSK